jgi:hypothetical protein
MRLGAYPISIQEISDTAGECPMTLRMESADQFAHRANVAKYQKILATYLTAEERRFVERRLAEEQIALQQIAAVPSQQMTELCVL